MKWSILLTIAAVVVAIPPCFAQTRTVSPTYPTRGVNEGRAQELVTPDVVDLNSAPKAQLMSLPGVTDAYATKIINGRPYRSMKELVSKKILPSAAYERIKDMVTLKEGKPKK